MDHDRKKGLAMLLGPLGVFICSTILFGVWSYVFGLDNFIVAAVSFALCMFVVVPSFVAALICVPLGIIKLSRRPKNNTVYQIMTKEEYQKLSYEEVSYISSWSWGAFFGGPVWALANFLWVWAAFSFVPVVNLYVWFKLALDGRQMSWKKGNWESFHKFRQRQKLLGWAAPVIWLGWLVFQYIR